MNTQQREKERLLWDLKSLPNELDDLLGNLDEEMLRWRPIPNKWSIKEVLCHLRDIEREFHALRYRKLITEHEPYLPEVDQNRLAEAGDYINQDAVAARAEFKGFRDETVKMLEAAPAEDWDRAGNHWSGGRLTIAQLVARHCDHDVKHLIQMKDVVRLKMPW
jgi:hypothetical protein